MPSLTNHPVPWKNRCHCRKCTRDRKCVRKAPITTTLNQRRTQNAGLAPTRKASRSQRTSNISLDVILEDDDEQILIFAQQTCLCNVRGKWAAHCFACASKSTKWHWKKNDPGLYNRYWHHLPAADEVVKCQPPGAPSEQRISRGPSGTRQDTHTGHSEKIKKSLQTSTRTQDRQEEEEPRGPRRIRRSGTFGDWRRDANTK